MITTFFNINLAIRNKGYKNCRSLSLNSIHVDFTLWEQIQRKAINIKIFTSKLFVIAILKKGGAEDKFHVPKQKNDYVN